MQHPFHPHLIESYTRIAAKQCRVARPTSVEALSEIIAQLGRENRPLCMMGGGNSFGDVFIPRESTIIDCTGLHAMLDHNATTGRTVVECGMRSGPLSAFLMQNGFYLTGSAGSLTNTVAGDMASNVNGKDSWKHGNFGSNVVAFDLLTARGETIHVDETNLALRNGVLGGLGMLGIITRIHLAPKVAPSDQLIVDRVVTASLRETINTFLELSDAACDFVYAWVDVLGSASTIGRAVIEKARFDGNSHAQVSANAFQPKQSILGLSDDRFWAAYRGTQIMLRTIGMDRHVAQAVNTIHYQTSKLTAGKRAGVALASYQYPMLKTLPNWNKGISSKGMQEVQLLFGAQVFEAAFVEVQAILKKYGVYPLICAMRRHRADNGLLSFSGDGLSFTVNYDRISLKDDATCYRMERELMAAAITHSGKVYLSKFPYVTADECATMYPELNRMKALKAKLDPNNLFASNASGRLLGLT